MKHLDKETIDGTQQNLAALYQLFPSCFTEAPAIGGGKNLRQVVDWGKLRELLGDNVADDEPEVYDFTWVGKRAAQREAMAPIRKTLRPCPEESVNWDTTQNLYIEGDNLEVLKLLQNSYMGKVKMIYIDPPYNTGNDFVYHDDFHRTQKEEDEAAGVINEEGERMVKNTESNGKFHSDWCSMIYSRLLIARSLLTEDGVIFISIDENEVDNLQKIANEVFGETNFISQLIWAAGRKNDSKYISVSHEYILCYVKSQDYLKENKITWRERKQGLDDIYSQYDRLKSAYYDDTESIEKELKLWYRNLPDGHPAKDHSHYNKVDSNGIYFADNISWPGGGGPKYEVLHPITHKPVHVPSRGWITNKETLTEWIKLDRVDFGPNESYVPTLKAYLKDREYSVPYSVFYKDGRAASKRLATLMGDKVFENPKDEEIISRLVDFASSEDDIIFDFFSGSGTTAHAIFLSYIKEQKKRKFILVQWPEIIDPSKYPVGKAKKVAQNAVDLLDSMRSPHNICEIGKERIRRAGKKIKEEHPEAKDLDIGFRVFKCDDSNYKEVAFAPKDYSQESLDLFVDNIKEDRSDLDLLFDCMLRWGITLDLPMTKTKVDGCTIHNVNEGGLVACFDGIITEKVIDAIAEMYPAKIVFRDSSFEEAAQKMNLFELFKQKCNWTEQEVRNNVRVI